MISLVLAAAAATVVIGGDIWCALGARSVMNEIGRLALTASDLFACRVVKIGIVWHVAAVAVCFGGAAAWFAWLGHLPDPDADFGN